ncbi:diguanylate cyclase [Rhodopseudomonas sp. AAP120]|uniref:putative bifunctional diguanylate cyclase/phosphodiesterase n=1 Tax=Rhodopseudomonas sp. AAP120 TaxID=1523430 RepID=UPI0006B94E94|nr:EAL domain-containing protein [Rhodopseudomonas sp. AAP120]KPF95624.1 diguanylate cyclase [Rhodopseudomonas sp. AAP120]
MFRFFPAWDQQHVGLVALGLALCLLGGMAAAGALRFTYISSGRVRRGWVVAGCVAAVCAVVSALTVALLLALPDEVVVRNIALAIVTLTILGMTVTVAMAVWSGAQGTNNVRSALAERVMVLDAVVREDTLGFCLFSPDGRLESWNEAFLEIYAIPPGQPLAGSRLRELIEILRVSGNHLVDLEQLAEIKAASTSGEPSETIAALRDGRHIKIEFRPLPNGGWIAKHSDVTDYKMAEQRFAYVTLHDLATGLPNRAAFNQRIVQSLAVARERHASFAVIRLGIDRFKEINDVFGQSVGDAVLARMAARLTETCHWGFLARPGGDEFSIVTPPDQAEGAVQEICAQVAELCDIEFEIEGHTIRVGSTAGVSIYPRDGDNADALIAHADVALYRAKTERRGTVCLFEPAMDLQIREKRAVQRELAVALENGEFELHYQPQATTEGEIVGFEALLRWRHPIRGMVSPAVFIPLAEETGLIGAIDEWVLRTACLEAASWPKPLAIAVNLSPLDFRRLDVPALILQVLVETGLDPKRLEVEITEGVLIDDFAGAIAILRRIKNLGVRVAMDDFGAGYSSLSYLQSFSFDKIKIDQVFTRKLEINPDSAAIVEAILDLARRLKLPVIAEGVETESQLAFLAGAGCQEVQGYLIGRPHPIEQYRHVTGVAAPAQPVAQAG